MFRLQGRARRAEPAGRMRMEALRGVVHDRLALGALLALVALGFLLTRPGGGSDVESVLVADLRGHALIVLDPAHPEAARRISLPGGPHEVVRLPDGRVAVSLEQSGVIAVVDIDGGEVETHRVGGLPHGLWVDGDTLLATDRSVDAIRRFDLASWREGASMPAGASPHAIARLEDGRVVVASAGDDALTLGGETIAVSAAPETVAVSPDGGRVATAGSIGGSVEVFTTAGERLVTYDLGGRPVRVAWSPDGSLLAVALSAAHQVALIDTDDRITRVGVAGTPDGLAFTADGRRLYVSDTYAGRVTAVNVGRGAVAAVIEAGASTGALFVLTP